MQAKRVHVVATGADVVGEERHHGVEGKGVGEEVSRVYGGCHYIYIYIDRYAIVYCVI